MPSSRRQRKKLLAGVHIGLALFFVITFARVEDWIPGISVLPVAKIAAAFVLLAFMFSIREIRWPLPREAVFLILLVLQLFVAVPMSHVWPGGAFQKALEFSKVALIVLVFISVVTTFKLLRRFIFIQAASVATIATISLWHREIRYERLQSVLGGDYADPNSLALAIVVSLPLCLVLMFLSKNVVRKAIWAVSIVAMIYVVFLTGSRSGAVSLVAMGAVCVWEFSIRGRRRYLLPAAAVLGLIALYFAGGMLLKRWDSTFSFDSKDLAAYGSAQAREMLFWRSLEVTAQHPLFGVGPGNFAIVSGIWHVTHNSYTEMSSEGGLPAFILFALILWKGFRNTQKVKKLGRQQNRLSLMAKALQASLVGYTVGAAFISTAYEYLPYILIAYTTALAWIAANYVASTSESKSEISAVTDAEIYSLNGDVLPLAVERSQL